jgi:hypothetical protein
VVASVSGGANNYGIYCDVAIDCTITQVTTNVYGGSNVNTGIFINGTFSSRVQDARSEASGGNSTGVTNNCAGSVSVLQIIQSYAYGGSDSVSDVGGCAYTSIGTSQLFGAVSGTGFTCVGDYNSSFVGIGTSCQ